LENFSRLFSKKVPAFPANETCAFIANNRRFFLPSLLAHFVLHHRINILKKLKRRQEFTVRKSGVGL
jgi:hypothetical protein